MRQSRLVRAFGLSAAAMVALAACTSGAAPSASVAPSEAPSVAPSEAPSVAPSEAAPTAIRWTFDWKPDGDWAPILFAEKNGYFADANVEVTFVEGNGSSDALPLIGTGQVDVGQISGPPLILGVPQEIPVTAVGVQMFSSPNVMICDKTKVATPKDIEGNRFGDQAGEFEHAVWLAWAKANSIDISKVEIVPAAGTGDALFIEGQLDCWIDFYTSGAMIGLTEGRPGEEILFPIRDTLTLYGHTTVVNNDFLAQNPDAVRGFVKALAQGMQYTIENPQEAIDLIIEKYPDKNNPEGIKATEWSVEKYVESWSSDQATANGLLSFTEEGWTSTKQTIVDGGLTNGEDIDISALYTNEYLPDPPIKP